MGDISVQSICITCNKTKIVNLNKTKSYIHKCVYRSDHGGMAVLLPGFVIKCQQNQLTRQTHIIVTCTIINSFFVNKLVNMIQMQIQQYHGGKL